MDNFTSSTYFNEVESTANYIVEVAVENLEHEGIEVDRDSLSDAIYDYVLNEQIDGHKYAIYYAYHLPILQYSDNAEYGVSEFGSDWIGDTLKKDGLTGLHAALAYWAFYADVSDLISDAIDNYIDNMDQE